MDLYHVYQITDGARKYFTWSQVKKKRRKRPENKWEMEARRVMKQKNLRPEDIVNRKVW